MEIIQHLNFQASEIKLLSLVYMNKEIREDGNAGQIDIQTVNQNWGLWHKYQKNYNREGKLQIINSTPAIQGNSFKFREFQGIPM